MLKYKQLVLLQLVVAAHLSLGEKAVATLRCPDCVKTKVPFPLSTTPSCGDQLYKVTCNAGKLFFNTINGSSYIITSIFPEIQQLIVGSKGLKKNSCTAKDIETQGIWLNESLPFKITNTNTVLNFNCTNYFVSFSAMDCTLRSPCYAYMNSSRELKKCIGLHCCSYTTGGSKTAHRVEIADEANGCNAYLSFANVNASLPVTKWPEPGVQIKWKKPGEPTCKLPADCQRLPNSTCLADRALAGLKRTKRCYCNKGFLWDPVSGICESESPFY